MGLHETESHRLRLGILLFRREVARAVENSACDPGCWVKAQCQFGYLGKKLGFGEFLRFRSSNSEIPVYFFPRIEVALSRFVGLRPG